MKRLSHTTGLWLLVIAALFLLPSCNASKAAKGAGIGGTVGGVVGGIIGKNNGNTATGILIGAAIGGSAGALIGNYMDKQAEEIEEDLEGAEVERVGEGILITFDSGLMFDLDSDQLRSATKQNLQELSEVLKKYEDTNILIQGHTDSQGSEEYNDRLAMDRANSVSYYLASQGVQSARITEQSYGEHQPVATNETAAGRQQNRRVEVAIYANKKLQRAAERGDL